MAETKTITAADLIAKFQYALDNNWGYIWGKAGVLWTKAAQEQMNKRLELRRQKTLPTGGVFSVHSI